MDVDNPSDDNPLFSPPPSPPPIINNNGLPPPSVLDAALKFDWQEFRAKDLPNTHFITPFILRTNWHKFFHPYREHIAKLRELVTALANDEFPTLKDFIKSLWHTETEAVANALDPTMAFLAFISPQPTRDFCGPKVVTNLIAKLCWGIKLASLAEIHMLVARGVCTDQLEAFKRIERFVVEHKLTAFSSLCSLTHYATSLVLNMLSLPQVVWVDREEWKEMLFLGCSISLPKLQEILGTIEDRMVDLWENRIMLGLRIHVKYGTLADNLTNTIPGYSFLNNLSNPFSDHNNLFIQELFNDPQLAK
ncbi:hypothetical protein DFH09DRAFT_1319973 [Mycena vulgaris]|nr:hypothetical protein DFH09DRAFT_1319973 [Mycena vulgaris]